VSKDSGRDTRSARDRRDQHRNRAARHTRRPILTLPHRLELLKLRQTRLDPIEAPEDAFDLSVTHDY
jgi:hypothetical protein